MKPRIILAAEKLTLETILVVALEIREIIPTIQIKMKPMIIPAAEKLTLEIILAGEEMTLVTSPMMVMAMTSQWVVLQNVTLVKADLHSA